MRWSERFATGIPELDNQHKLLFRMAGDYRQALDEQRGERMYALWLESLDEYAKAHFGIEEACMHRYSCPVAATNSAAHRRFTEMLGTFRARHAERGFEPADARQLVEFVEHWLSSHIGGIDVQLKPCVEGTDR
jgi:hemerythrin